jgi:hypothetical protein
VRLKVGVAGAGGEVYTRFLAGKTFHQLKTVVSPRFEVLDVRGWRIGRGTLAEREQEAYTGSWKVPSWYADPQVTIRAEFDLGALGSLKSRSVSLQLPERHS